MFEICCVNTFGMDWCLCVCVGGYDALIQYRLYGAKHKFENVNCTESKDCILV